jgi:hypothetical protein
VPFWNDDLLYSLSTVDFIIVEWFRVNVDLIVLRPYLKLIGFQHLKADLPFEENLTVDNRWHLSEFINATLPTLPMHGYPEGAFDLVSPTCAFVSGSTSPGSSLYSCSPCCYSILSQTLAFPQFNTLFQLIFL